MFFLFNFTDGRRARRRGIGDVFILNNWKKTCASLGREFCGRSRFGRWGDQEPVIEHVKTEMPLKYPREGVENTVGYTTLKFRREGGVEA